VGLEAPVLTLEAPVLTSSRSDRRQRQAIDRRPERRPGASAIAATTPTIARRLALDVT